MKRQYLIEVDIEPKALKPLGYSEWLPDKQPDIDAMVRHKVGEAFVYVEGFSDLKVWPIAGRTTT